MSKSRLNYVRLFKRKHCSSFKKVVLQQKKKRKKSIASRSENTTEMQFDKQPSIIQATVMEKCAIGTFIKGTVDSSLSISFCHDFLILFTQSKIGEKRCLTLWMRYHGVRRRRVLFSIFAAATAAFTAAIPFNQFIHHLNNAVQALPHVGPHPILKKA